MADWFGVKDDGCGYPIVYCKQCGGEEWTVGDVHHAADCPIPTLRTPMAHPAEATLAALAASLGCGVEEVQGRVAALVAITEGFPWLSPHEIADRLRRVDAEYDAYSEGMYKSAKPLVEAVASLVVFVPPKPAPFQRSKRAPATPDAKEE